LAGFLLIPLYTRHLTTSDYGIMAVTGTITSVLSILFPLSLHSAAGRFHFSARDEGERRLTIGTIWISMILVGLGAAVVLDQFGSHIFPVIFRDVPFHLYIRPAIWISFLSTLSLLPLVTLQVRERPVPYVLITLSRTLLTIGLVVNWVVRRSQGAYGYLLGTLQALVILAIPHVILTLRNARLTWRRDIFTAALAFSLPLVPHSLAGWTLQLSDRAILQRVVPLGELGLYSLGYQLGTAMSLFSAAVNAAWVPFLYKVDAQKGDAAKPELARLTTYYVFFLCFMALGLALLAREIIFLIAAPSFHAAFRVSPWVVGGLLWDGLYYIPVSFLFLKRRTGLIPLITVSSAVVNVLLNIWLVPQYGIMAAAWATFLSFGLMLALAWVLAVRVYPFPYEYKRLGTIVLAGVVLFALGVRLQAGSVQVVLVGKGALLLSYPFVLALLGFYTRSEKKTAWRSVRQVLTALHGIVHPR